MNRPKTKNQLRARRHIRVRSRVSGDAQKPRLVVFRSLQFTYAQLIDDNTGKTLASAHDMTAKKGKAGTKMDRALNVGKELAEKATKAGIKACVFDRNGYKYHGRVKAVADGAREGGLTL